MQKVSGLGAGADLGDYWIALESLGRSESVRACVACPPQVGKTTSCLHMIALLLITFPKLKIAYASHAQTFSDTQSRVCRDLYEAGGGKFGGTNTVKEWVTPEGGSFYSTSWEGSLIGRRVDILICDDLFKNSMMAESAEQREHVQNWFDGVAMQRMWPGGDVIVIGSRWHPDDLSGRLIAKGWPEICIPAVREFEDGTEVSIWPDVKPVSFFDNLRIPSSPDFIGNHAWNAAYQGKPVPRDGTLFGPPQYYVELPTGAVCCGIGLDMASSVSGSSDFSALVALYTHEGLYYVEEVKRTKQLIVDVEFGIRDMQQRHGNAMVSSYVAASERAILDLMFYRGVEVQRLPARTSKWARSQRCSIAWKAGKILVKKNQTWTKAFVHEVQYFTGNEGQKDDQVDSLVSAYDAHALTAPVGWASAAGFTFGRLRDG